MLVVLFSWLSLRTSRFDFHCFHFLPFLFFLTFSVLFCVSSTPGVQLRGVSCYWFGPLLRVIGTVELFIHLDIISYWTTPYKTSTNNTGVWRTIIPFTSAYHYQFTVTSTRPVNVVHYWTITCRFDCIDRISQCKSTIDLKNVIV